MSCTLGNIEVVTFLLIKLHYTNTKRETGKLTKYSTLAHTHFAYDETSEGGDA